MPHCENKNCNKQLASHEIQEGGDGKLVCSSCVTDNKVTPLHPERTDLVLNREFDYAIGYTKKRGLQAHVRLGGAKLSLEVSQEEIASIFGPEVS